MPTYYVQDDEGDSRPGGRLAAIPTANVLTCPSILGERAWVKRRYPTVRQIYEDSTSQSVTVFLQDSSSSTGAGLTGLAYNSSGLVCYYRKGATGTATQLALATQTAGGAYSSGGFAEISSSNTPGLYRVDLPNSLLDTVGEVRLMIFGASNLAPYEETIQVIPATVTVGTNNDKSGYSISGTKTTLDSLNDITAASVWASGTRTLSAFGFTVDTNAVTLASSQPNYAPAVAGDAMTLTSGERTAVANEVESQIIDDTDSEKVLTAITDKIASVNPSLSGLTLSAIASQVRTELGTELGRIDVAVSTRLATSGYTAPIDVSANVSAIKAVTDNLADTIEDNAGTYRFTTAALSQAPSGGGGLDAAGVRAAVGLAAADLDDQLADVLRKGESQRHTNVSSGETVDIIITDTP